MILSEAPAPAEGDQGGVG